MVMLSIAHMIFFFSYLLSISTVKKKVEIVVHPRLYLPSNKAHNDLRTFIIFYTKCELKKEGTNFFTTVVMTIKTS